MQVSFERLVILRFLPVRTLFLRGIIMLFIITAEAINIFARENVTKNIKNEQNFTAGLSKIHIDSVHTIITERFDVQLLEKFYAIYGNEFSEEIKNENYQRTLLAENLQLKLPFNQNKLTFYDEFIRLAAPSDRAFMALQNLIAPDLQAKKWKQAAATVQKYQPFFGNGNHKISRLLEMLNASTDKSVKINSLTGDVNTEQGGEFSPVFPSGEKRMYFCGTGRTDNIGGEDIFVSEHDGKVWTKPTVIDKFSTANFNDAPVSISTDGTQMLFVRNGKFFTAHKTSLSWTIPELLDGPFYSFGKVLDGAFTPDGKGVLFTATHTDKIWRFFGDNADIFSQTDIFVSLRDENNFWSHPVNIGKNVNTQQNERSPFLHADMKTLYFSSDGHGGFGKMDVYKSERLSDSCWTCWSTPENIGKELNTIGDDIGFKISVNGDKAYFARSNNMLTSVSVLMLIDVSGSMSGQKLDKVKFLTRNVLKQTAKSKIETALLSYSGQCNLPLTDSCGFDASLRLKQQFIDNLVSTGKTTTSEAYKAAVSYLQRNALPQSTQKFIIVITDEDICVCNKPEIAFQLMEKSGKSGVCESLVFDISEDSVLFSNFKTQNPALPASRLFSLITDTNNKSLSAENLNLTGFEDLYEAVLPLKMRPDVVSTIAGKIKKADDKPVSAKVIWNDIASGKNNGILYSDPADGSYYLVLPHGKFYGYYAEADSLLNESYHLDLKSEKSAKHIVNDMRLFKIDELVASGEALRLNNVFFNFDESSLLPESLNELMRWAEIIKNKKLKVEISGHTDSVGAELYNLKLSEKRAEAVKNFLISQGCNANALHSSGYGKSQPHTSNSTDKGRALNRRVELKITGNM